MIYISNTIYILIIALIFAIIAVVGVIGVMFNFGKPGMMSKFGGIFGILTFILAIIAVLYFMTALPGASNLQSSEGEDIGFWYSESQSFEGYEMSISAGPGFSWYLLLISGIIALIGAIPLLKKQQPL